jgi:hypothetical protein
MLKSIQPEKLTIQRDGLLAEIQADDDWVLLNSMGALPANLKFDLIHERINEDIFVEGEDISVFIKHKTTGNMAQENGTNVPFDRHEDLSEDMSQWPEGQKADLYEQAWGTGYGDQQKLIAEVLCLQKIKNAIS